MLSATVDLSGVKASLERFAPSVVAALEVKMRSLTMNLQAHVVNEKLHGQVLRQLSGKLARSIQTDQATDGSVVTGEVFSSGDVKYAAIHEYGGVIHHPGGTPFIPGVNGGKAEFVSNLWAGGLKGELPRTKPHDIKMPERSFLRSSLSDQASDIAEGLRKAAIKGAREALGQ